MKKLMITAIVAVAFIATTNAQEIAQVDTKTEKTVEVQQEFKKIEVDKVPAAVKDAVSKEFKGATISEAYVNARKEYKLVLQAEGTEAKTVYANAEGKWIKPKA